MPVPVSGEQWSRWTVARRAPALTLTSSVATALVTLGALPARASTGEPAPGPSSVPAVAPEPGPAAAASAPPPAVRLGGHRTLEPTWLLDPGRVRPTPPERGLLRLAAHGEYALRLHSQTAIELPRHGDDPTTDELDQGSRLVHWLRLNPSLDVGESLRLVAQADAPFGMFAGQPNRYVSAAAEPWDTLQPLRGELRWLFLEWRRPSFELRVGQQPSHWGLGLVENDGDHPPPFGDYAGGTRGQGVRWTWRPAGEGSATRLSAFADRVETDPLAALRDDDEAWRAALAFEQGVDRNVGVGVLLLGRLQDSPLEGALDADAQRRLYLATADVAAHAAAPLPGELGMSFAEVEIAVNRGEWREQGTAPGSTLETRVEAHGAAVRVGAVVLGATQGRSFGRFVSEIEWGWATGDADPYDGVDRRFRFAPGHRVGMLLFNEVLAWKTARSATIARDGSLGPSPRPEGRGLPTDGAVAGATYLAPHLVVRPWRDLDLAAGAVVAQATADVVDPVRSFRDGRAQNFDGGDPRAHDLGLELDTRAELRAPLATGLILQVGAEAAVLFPGYAFADASGQTNAPVLAATSRLGVQF